MRAPFFIPQLDYILFVDGAAFFILGAVCLFFLRHYGAGSRLPWAWLGAFGVLYGVCQWLGMAAVSLGDSDVFRTARFFLTAGALMLLSEFSRRGWNLLSARRVSLWVYFYLVLSAAAGGWYGWSGLDVAVRYVLIPVAGGAAGVVFLRFRRVEASVFSRISAGLLGGSAVFFFSYSLATGAAGFFPAFAGTQAPWICFLSAIAAAFCVLLFAVKEGAIFFFRHDIPRERRLTAWTAALFFVFLIYLAIGWRIVDVRGQRTLREESSVRALKARLYAQFFDMTMSRLQTIRALSSNPQVIAAMTKQPLAAQDLDMIHERLDRYRLGLGADVCFAMDTSGLTIASTNRRSPDSFIGKSYAFRPYFQEALKGAGATYLALGATSGTRGIYAAYPISAGSGVVGVVVAKGSTEVLDAYFRSYPHVFLVSPEGVVFVSSRPEWILRSLYGLSPIQREALRGTAQFGRGPWDSVGFEKMSGDRDKLLRGGEAYYYVEEPVASVSGWKVIFMDTSTRAAVARLTVILVLLSFLLLVVVVFLLALRLVFDKWHLQASENLYAALIEGSPDGVVVCDKKGACLSINQSGLGMIGLERQDVIGRSFVDLWGAESRARVRQALQRVVGGDRQVFDANVYHISGGHPVDVSVTLVPILGAGKQTGYFVCHARDISQEKRSREHLVQSSKMATVGSLATGVAHEFNNVLEIILAHAEMAQAGQDPEAMRRALRAIIDSSRRGAWIAKTMLDFSGKSLTQRERVDVAEVIRQDLVLLGKSLEAVGVTVETFFQDVPKVYGNPGQLSQVFTNIMVNARDTMRGLPERRLVIRLEADISQARVNVIFEDTGAGISPEIKDKLFGPFVTTKGLVGGGFDQQPGVGLGLFISYGMIKQHGGDITIDPRDGGGTVVRVILPIFSGHDQGKV